MTAARIAALIAIATACGDSPSDPPSDPFTRLPVWTLATEPDLRIGRFDGPDEYTFSGVMDAALAGDTLLVVADGGANEIRLYDLDGSFVRAIGGPGSGPGEFENVWRIEIGDGTVAGWDQRLMRLSTFSLEGELVASVQWRTPPYAGTPFFIGLGTDGTGYARLRGGGDHESIMGRPEGRFRETAVYARCGRDGMCEPIYRVPGEEQIVQRGDHGFQIVTAFLGRTPAATVIGNALVVGSTDSLYLERIAPDGSRQPLVRQPLAPRPFTDHDWEAYRESMEKLIARAEEEGMDYVGGIHRPTHPTYPPFDAIEAGTDGNLWVREYPEFEPDRWRWWVFDAGGRPLGRFASDPVQLASLDTARVVAVERDEIGVESVVLYRVVRSTAGETP